MLYQAIADAIRADIRAGRLGAGDALPPVREMAARWACAPGTVQRAYRDLSDEGLIVSRTGQGTRVAPQGVRGLMRGLRLVNEVEARLLDLLGKGYSVRELEGALWMALDQIRARQAAEERVTLRFVGSHDPALSAVIAGEYPIEMTFAGSLNGLLQLAGGQADFAGCHLWDSDTHSYNIAYIRRLLPGKETAVMTMAHRRLGLMTAPENPLNVGSLVDLMQPNVTFINRQAGAGTRVWLDDQLAQAGVDTAQIRGYERVAHTHAAVAQAVASGEADAGVGVEAAARVFGLAFIPLATERYDLVIPAERWESAAIQALVGYLQLASTRQAIRDLGGYDTSETGRLAWVE